MVELGLGEAYTAIKSQALAEYMAHWKEAHETTPIPEPEHWVMYFDGSKLLHGSGLE
jgi:hypothetical protein